MSPTTRHEFHASGINEGPGGRTN